MNAKEVAARLRISPALVYSLIASGKLGCYRIGNGRGVLRISEDHLAAYLAGTEPGPPVAVTPPPRLAKLKHLRLS